MRRRRDRKIESHPESVVFATSATLRRNVKGEKFLPAFDQGRRESFIRELLDGATAAFDDLRIPRTRINSLETIGDIVLCDGMQAIGLLPEFPLHESAGAGFVMEGDEHSSPVCTYIPSSLAACCGIEDHFELRSVVQGFDPEGAWAKLDALDTALNDHFEYAFRRDIGYLTANPNNAGNGLELCVYVMPIGLEMLNAAEETMRDMRRRGCVFEQAGSVPGVYSGLCKVSFDCGGGRGEPQCVRGFARAVDELVERELDARAEFSNDQSRPFLLDAFARDLAILKSAYAISADEAIAKLWTVRVGLDAGYVSGVDVDSVEALIGGIRSPGLVTAMRNGQALLDSLTDIFSSDDEARDDVEDDIDTLRADELRRILAKAKVVE